MNGNALTKLARLGRHLLTHPRHVLPYLTTGPLCRRSPLELGVPWFAQTAIEFLEHHVTRKMHVFEYGAGGSTLFFARRAAAVICAGASGCIMSATITVGFTPPAATISADSCSSSSPRR